MELESFVTIEAFLSEIVAVEHSFPMRDVGVSVFVTWELRYCTNGTTGAIRLTVSFG